MQTEEYSNIHKDTADQFLDFIRKYDADDSWYDISVKSYAIYKSKKEANEWLTWKDKGYITFLNLLMVYLVS